MRSFYMVSMAHIVHLSVLALCHNKAYIFGRRLAWERRRVRTPSSTGVSRRAVNPASTAKTAASDCHPFDAMRKRPFELDIRLPLTYRLAVRNYG